MKRLTSLLPLSFLFILLIFPSISFSTTRGVSIISKEGQNLYLYKDYHALIVGISNYEKWPKLPNAIMDAKEVAAKLKMKGFKVKLVLDPTYRELKTALTEMIYKMGSQKNRAVLFYYAGHGATETLADNTKMGYIIPIDCPFLENDPLGFATHSISMRDIESISLRIKAKHVLMLFDSCFSGSLFALVRAMPNDITEKSTLPVRQYITAGREDEQVPDKSMFKRCLLIGLDGDADLTGDGYITGSELGMYLSDKVINYTHRRQHPQYGKINNPDLDRGDFIFNVRKIQASAVSSSPISLEADKQSLTKEREQVEHERKEVERLKLEIERKKLEAELKRLEAEKKKIEIIKQKDEQVKKENLASIPKLSSDGNEELVYWLEGEWMGYYPGVNSPKRVLFKQNGNKVKAFSLDSNGIAKRNWIVKFTLEGNKFNGIFKERAEGIREYRGIIKDNGNTIDGKSHSGSWVGRRVRVYFKKINKEYKAKKDAEQIRGKNIEERLKKLRQLYDTGLISEEEFKEKKSEILEEI